MPVQRIARYPLLLQTIQKHTDKSHPAYALLEQTAHTSIALNCRINEYKRFREVGKKCSSNTLLSYNLITENIMVFPFMVQSCVIQLAQQDTGTSRVKDLIPSVAQQVEEGSYSEYIVQSHS